MFILFLVVITWSLFVNRKPTQTSLLFALISLKSISFQLHMEKILHTLNWKSHLFSKTKFVIVMMPLLLFNRSNCVWIGFEILFRKRHSPYKKPKKISDLLRKAVRIKIASEVFTKYTSASNTPTFLSPFIFFCLYFLLFLFASLFISLLYYYIGIFRLFPSLSNLILI